MTLATGSFAMHFVLVSIALTPLPTRVHTAARFTPLPVRLISPPVTSGALPVSTGIAGLKAPALVRPEDLLSPTVENTAEARTAYLPSTMLERRPTPISEPDITMLQGLKASGLPVRLRIYVDRFGKVDRVKTLQASLGDQEFANGVRLMFLATAFLPGRHAGIDVPSYLDIELVGQ